MGCYLVRLVAGVIVWLALSAVGAAETVSFAYLQREDDPAFDVKRKYTGLTLRVQRPALTAINAGLREARVVGRALGTKFQLLEHQIAADQDPVAAAKVLQDEQGVSVFFLDLPYEDVTAIAAGMADQNVILLNFRHRADALRAEACSPVMFHTIPSNAMRMDGFAQFLREKKWDRILVLEGMLQADQDLSRAFQAAAKKFGLKIAEVRRFELSNNPRHRDRNNITLLTGDEKYDVVFLADSVGEFGRYVPYQTQLARPVIGSEGLRASAWHWTWERHGAPQLNQRFDKKAKRRMEAVDWGAWAAVKSIVEAVTRLKKFDVAAIRNFWRSEEFVLDAYKGNPASFRSWNNQLRQPILLHTHNAVIERLPLDSFLHHYNVLDTLGRDERESTCKF